MTFTPRQFFARAPQSQQRDWCRIEAKQDATGTASADLYLYDEIGYWGTSATDLVAQVAGLDVDTLNVFINSPGGDAWDGIAMMNVLRRHKAEVHVTVDGLAASAASLIAMAGDTITMARGSELMIHDAAGMAWGNSATMAEMVNLLDKLSDSYASAYAARAGGDPADWRDIMRVETWYTAAEAVSAGLADRLDDDKDGAKAKAKFDLSMFAHAGRRAAPAPTLAIAAASHMPPASEPGQPTHQKKEEADMASNPEFMAGLRERLGITDANLDESGILAALDETLTEHAETPTPAAPVAQLPEGVVAVEASQLADLQAAAAEVRAMRAERDAERRGALVASAIADGRIPPARAEFWTARLKADEDGFAPVLASLGKGDAVPLAEVGHSDDVDTADDILYAKVSGPTKKEAN